MLFVPMLIVVVIAILFSVFRNRGGRPAEIDGRPSDSGEGGSYPFFADAGVSGHGQHHSHDSGPPCDSSSGASDCGGSDGGGSGGSGAGD
jgi:hypothetical protein